MKLPRRNKIDKKKINKDLKKFYNIKYKNLQKNYKPNGFWYSCGNSWYDWIIREDMEKDFLHKYIYKINIIRGVKINIRKKDKSKLLFINNNKDFESFHKKYKRIDNTEWINWKKVSEHYGGIEICPYLYGKRRKYMWYSGWDVASGCIWNTKTIIKNIELIYEMKNKKYKKVIY